MVEIKQETNEMFKDGYKQALGDLYTQIVSCKSVEDIKHKLVMMLADDYINSWDGDQARLTAAQNIDTMQDMFRAEATMNVAKSIKLWLKNVPDDYQWDYIKKALLGYIDKL